jgi:hypothetical protein
MTPKTWPPAKVVPELIVLIFDLCRLRSGALRISGASFALNVIGRKGRRIASPL